MRAGGQGAEGAGGLRIRSYSEGWAAAGLGAIAGLAMVVFSVAFGLARDHVGGGGGGVPRGTNSGLSWDRCV